MPVDLGRRGRHGAGDHKPGTRAKQRQPAAGAGRLGLAGEHLADDVEQHPERREPPVRLPPRQPRRDDRRGPPPGRVSGERQHLLQPLPALRRPVLRPEHQPRHGRGHVRGLVPFLAAGRHRHHAEFGRHRQHRDRRGQPLHSNGRRVHEAGLPAAGPSISRPATALAPTSRWRSSRSIFPTGSTR